MGQRTVVAVRRRAGQPDKAQRSGVRGDRAVERVDPTGTRKPWLMAFPTELGWIGVLGSERGVARLTLGYSSLDDVRRAMARATCSDRSEGPGNACAPAETGYREADGDPELRRQLEKFARGEVVDFRGVRVDLPAMTAFQERVIEATRGIGYGETLTYAELAARSGKAGAARAVGNVMAGNRIPLIIPCHRVVAAGRLGGYSAPQGVDLKKRLLAMECGQA